MLDRTITIVLCSSGPSRLITIVSAFLRRRGILSLQIVRNWLACLESFY